MKVASFKKEKGNSEQAEKEKALKPAKEKKVKEKKVKEKKVKEKKVKEKKEHVKGFEKVERKEKRKMKNIFKRDNNVEKKPMSGDTIYKIMLWVTMTVAGVFLIKNLIVSSIIGVVVIGLCLATLATIVTCMKLKKTKPQKKKMVLSIMLVIFVFIISLFSGKSFSDDFPLFLAVIGMTGLYLEPKITKMQIILIDIAFVIMGIVQPEKAGAIGQYILCIVCFTLAGFLFFLAIRRGRAFIDIAEKQASDSKNLLRSIREMGDILQTDFDVSSARIDQSTSGLKKGSDSITKGTDEVADDCNLVQDKIQAAGQQITDLGEYITKFEKSLAENQKNIDAMNAQLSRVTELISRSNTVFDGMKERMSELSIVAGRLSDISVKTTVLSLNAAVEAANVGNAGAGFEVVASEMKQLSENSDEFVVKVTDAVDLLMGQVDKTAQQFVDSTKELKQSENTMRELQGGFERLKGQFGELYENISNQGKSVVQVEDVFKDLRGKVSEMRSFSMENQSAVDEIIEAMNAYKFSIGRVITNTRGVKISSAITAEDE